MGYYFFSYGIDADKVKQSIGSKDLSLFEAIQETETFECYAEQDLKGHTTTKEALEQLIFDKPYNSQSRFNKNSAHAYWYAFIAICSHLGEAMPSTHEIKLSYETDLINQYLKEDFGIKAEIELLLCGGDDDFFGLPAVTDWPSYGLLSAKQLAAIQHQFSAITITDADLERLQEEDEDKEMAYDSIKQFKENVSYCLINGLSLISFCH